ncbi:Cytochrome c biogenesis protein CcdA [Saccharopolyspora antimicrobica]|uniref:Cytochrome c biogenesis protein CcdA n=1 Tax=Saccharopolyspora antimicrobica TaxID=455193 RepID=A0A1I5LXV3_9PSEU|nr:cytochrome c biogenesis CcdA family protein [Saccharopolyspora antimicrobica]RKT89054.1 cytochrome c biogenesis protein CcdA [Saccharopolyspora antimicrobica]SFP02013.1 Cytochrome c biogenesis protein CcdA [Saccharopolyspora antimicrobica]
MIIGYFGAFLGGVLSLLSPCSALLVPAFFAYAFADRVRLLLRTGIFYLGLATTLVPMGVAAGSVGALFNQHRDLVVLIGGSLMILLGAAQIFGFGFGSAAAQRLSGRIKISSALSVYLLGTVYGLAGFCAGPLLGSVLTMAMTGSSPAYGGILLAIYALGMAVPLFVIAALWDRFDLGRRRWLRGRELRIGPLRVHSTTLLSGLVFIALGVLFLTTDGTGSLSGLVSIDAQFTVQSWVQHASGLVSDQLVLLVVLVVLLVVSLLVTRKRRRGEARQDQDSTSG